MLPDRWVLLEPAEAPVRAVVEATGVDPAVARVLVNRGYGDVDLAREFLGAPLGRLPQPALLLGASEGAEVVVRAMRTGAPICVYGDYDVDGVTSAALLHTFFRQCGHDVRVFIPDRFRDGYGLHRERLIELVAQGVRLFISVDCGTTSTGEIEAVRQAGAEFIVCDHHVPGPERPRATALLNPVRPECGFPDKRLAAVGVTFFFAGAIKAALKQAGWPFPGGVEPDLKALLEFVALGTVADMVPLRGVNRLLVRHGLVRLGQTALPGLRALIAVSGGGGETDAATIGFRLGPRINAAGRLSDARFAFDLMTATDPEHATTLAQQLDTENRRRQTLEAAVLEAAIAQAEAQPTRDHALVLSSLGWHSGVVGIVASRIVERYHVPTFVLAEEGGIAKGSGRSIQHFDLVEALRACGGDAFFVRFGGHAHAAGVTLAQDRVATFREALAREVREKLPVEARRRTIMLDAVLSPSDATLGLLNALDRLEPFGQGNARPGFLLRDVTLSERRAVGKDGSRVRVGLRAPGAASLYGFGRLAQVEGLAVGDPVDAAVTLERNVYRGITSVQVKVLGIRLAGQAVEHEAPQTAA